MGGKNSGRGGMFSTEIAEQIVQALRAGAFKKHAAGAAGINERTLREWLTRGAGGEEPYAAFAEQCDTATSEDALRNQTIISQAAAGPIKGDWKAAAWNLERKHPLLYGRAAELRLLAEQRDRHAADALPEPEKPYSPWKPEPGKGLNS